MKMQHFAFVVLFVSIMSLGPLGCAEKTIRYTDGEGREIEYVNRGFDVKISGASFDKTADGGIKMNLENYESEAKVAQDAIKGLVDIAGRVIPAPVPAPVP